MNTYKFSLVLFIVFFAFSVQALGREHGVGQLLDMRQLAAEAQEKNLPVLLVVSQHHCPFCVKLRDEVLNPMVISGQYKERILMAELLMDDETDVVNIKGESVYPGSIAAHYNVWVTPTLLFIDHQGVEVARRMLGVNTIEMYGYYLDEEIANALQAVKQGPPYEYKVLPKHLNSSH